VLAFNPRLPIYCGAVMKEHDRQETLRSETPAEQYDRWYAGSADGSGLYDAYERPYHDSHYYPLYKSVLEEVVRFGGRRVLEVGCGSGSFAQLLFDRSTLDYQGYDFSEVAIRKARARTGRPGRFSVAKAGDESTSSYEHDTIVCLEVLEHIENDLEVVKSWKPGVACVCSVPNFDSPDHVRYFRHEDEIARRYGNLIQLASIRRVPRALVRGRGWREYLRQLRWSRDNPKRMLAMLGYKTFDNLAGWFLFSGRRITCIDRT
jgi:2-polyprenyl-3-methyl-5-hydroxy-6-metoxy-1,4-benzoquinol methylase